MSRFAFARWDACPAETIVRFSILSACLILSACDAGPPPAVAPQSPPQIASQRFPDASLLIDGVDPAVTPVTLSKDEAFPYSGSFRLANSDDGAQLGARLMVTLLVDREASGYDGEPHRLASAEAAGQVILARDLAGNVRVGSDGMVTFNGRMDPPHRAGEVEFRISVKSVGDEETLHVSSRILQFSDGEDSGE